MKFLKAAIVLVTMYPPAFFANAAGAGAGAGADAGGGAAGDVIQEEGQQEVTSTTIVSIDSNRVNKSQTFVPSDILELCILYLELLFFLGTRIRGRYEDESCQKFSFPQQTVCV